MKPAWTQSSSRILQINSPEPSMQDSARVFPTSAASQTGEVWIRSVVVFHSRSYCATRLQHGTRFTSVMMKSSRRAFSFYFFSKENSAASVIESWCLVWGWNNILIWYLGWASPYSTSFPEPSFSSMSTLQLIIWTHETGSFVRDFQNFENCSDEKA